MGTVFRMRFTPRQRVFVPVILAAFIAGCSSTAETPAATSASSAVSESSTTSVAVPDESSSLDLIVVKNLEESVSAKFECRVEKSGTSISAYGVDGSFAYRTEGGNMAVAYGGIVYSRMLDPSILDPSAAAALEGAPDAWLKAEVSEPESVLDISSPTACVGADLVVENLVVSSDDPQVANFTVTLPDGTKGEGFLQWGPAGSVTQIVTGEKTFFVTVGSWYSNQPRGVPAEADMPEASSISAEKMAVIAPLPTVKP